MKETYKRNYNHIAVGKVLQNNNRDYTAEMVIAVTKAVNNEEIENLTFEEEVLMRYMELYPTDQENKLQKDLDAAFDHEVEVHLELMKTGNFPQGSDKAINTAKGQLIDFILAAETHEGRYPKYPYNFYFKEEGKFVTMFNETNDAWVESFETLGQALGYLQGASTDEVKDIDIIIFETIKVTLEDNSEEWLIYIDDEDPKLKVIGYADIKKLRCMDFTMQTYNRKQLEDHKIRYASIFKNVEIVKIALGEDYKMIQGDL